MSRTTNHRTQQILNYLGVVGNKDETMFRHACAIFFTAKGYSNIELEKVFGITYHFVKRAQQLVKLNYRVNNKWTDAFDKEMEILLSKEYLLL